MSYNQSRALQYNLQSPLTPQIISKGEKSELRKDLQLYLYLVANTLWIHSFNLQKRFGIGDRGTGFDSKDVAKIRVYILIQIVNPFIPTVPTCAVRETASLGIMGDPRVPPLNPSETIVLSVNICQEWLLQLLLNYGSYMGLERRMNKFTVQLPDCRVIFLFMSCR